LILVKARGTGEAARQAAEILAPDGIAVTLQNGLGNLELLAQHVGSSRALQGSTAQGASTHGQPGVLFCGGSGTTYLADSAYAHDRVQALADLLRLAGLEVEVLSDVLSIVWGKLAINAAINPLTAILRVRNGALLQSVHARNLMRCAADEVAAVAAASGIPLPFSDAAQQAEFVAHRTAHNESSMLQDIQRRVETEIEAICGAVIRAGEAAGVPTPANTVLYALIKSLEETHDAEAQRL
jgi:2-dehydropantoate 2-reductase